MKYTGFPTTPKTKNGCSLKPEHRFSLNSEELIRLKPPLSFGEPWKVFKPFSKGRLGLLFTEEFEEPVWVPKDGSVTGLSIHHSLRVFMWHPKRKVIRELTYHLDPPFTACRLLGDRHFGPGPVRFLPKNGDGSITFCRPQKGVMIFQQTSEHKKFDDSWPSQNLVGLLQFPWSSH